MRYARRETALIVKWNLKWLAAELAAHLASLERDGKLSDACPRLS